MSGLAFMTPHEISVETGLSYDVVRRAIASGELKASKIRRRILIRRDWFDAWIDAHVLVTAAPAVPRGRASTQPTSLGGPGSLSRLRAIEHGEP